MAKIPEKTVAAEKLRYRLSRRFWSGRVSHEIGEVLSFVPGTQPKTAVLVTEPEPEISAAAENTAEDED